jgi:hypothetical protein
MGQAVHLLHPIPLLRPQLTNAQGRVDVAVAGQDENMPRGLGVSVVDDYEVRGEEVDSSGEERRGVGVGSKHLSED